MLYRTPHREKPCPKQYLALYGIITGLLLRREALVLLLGIVV